jgi:hypothetical protein
VPSGVIDDQSILGEIENALKSCGYAGKKTAYDLL